MLEFITRSINSAGKYKGTFQKGTFFVFIKDFASLMTFSVLYLGFLWLNGINTTQIWTIFGVIVLSLLFSFIANWLSNKYIAGVFFTIYRDYRLEIGEKLKKAPMGYFSDQSLSKILSCFTNVIKSLEGFSQLAITDTVSAMSITFFILLGMFFMNIKIGILSLILVAIAWIFIGTLFSKIKPLVQQEHDNIAKFHSALVDGIRGTSVLRSFPNINDNEVKNIHSSVYNGIESIKNIQNKMELVLVGYFRTYFAILNAFSIIVTIYSCILLSNSEINLAQALTVCTASFLLFNGLKQLEVSSILLVKNPEHLNYLEEVLDIPKLSDGNLTEVPANDIKFENVNFAYDTKNVINDLSFEIKDGYKTAIVGPSGSGKTTIINLISRFYDVDSGAIKIGGNNIKDYEIDTLLKELSLVFQDVYLFNDSIKNNIKFAKPSATDEEIIDVAKKAMCHDFIMEMPDGYETIVAEGGNTLSGGQKQRISIARALLKDASIILLDEATSSVDPENEYEIMKAITELTKNKTVISIAHRLSTVKEADQILVIDNGKLVQSGTHNELISTDGIYKTFIEAREKAVEWQIQNS